MNERYRRGGDFSDSPVANSFGSSTWRVAAKKSVSSANGKSEGVGLSTETCCCPTADEIFFHRQRHALFLLLVAASVAGVVSVDRLHHPRVPALRHKLSRADVSNHHRHEQQD